MDDNCSASGLLLNMWCAHSLDSRGFGAYNQRAQNEGRVKTAYRSKKDHVPTKAATSV